MAAVIVSNASAILGLVLLLGAALCDIRSYLIPNWVTAGVVLAAAVSLFLVAPDFVSVMLHLAAGCLILLIGFVLFARNLIGAGDVKLLAALALWTGFSDLPRLLLTTTLAGGILAFGISLWRKHRLVGGATLDQRLPYGIAIAIGGIDFCIRQLAIFHS